MHDQELDVELDEIDLLDHTRVALDLVRHLNSTIRVLEMEGATVDLHIRPAPGRDRVKLTVSVGTAA